MTELASAVMAKAMTERALSQAIVNLARLKGWLVHRDASWRSTGTDPGAPDLFMARGGAVRCIEVKSERGKLTPDQEAWRDALYSLKGNQVEYHVARPSDWLEGRVDEWLS